MNNCFGGKSAELTELQESHTTRPCFAVYYNLLPETFFDVQRWVAISLSNISPIFTNISMSALFLEVTVGLELLNHLRLKLWTVGIQIFQRVGIHGLKDWNPTWTLQLHSTMGLGPVSHLHDESCRHWAIGIDSFFYCFFVEGKFFFWTSKKESWSFFFPSMFWGSSIFRSEK